MPQLQISHVGHQDGQPQFLVVRGGDLKSFGPTTLAGPDQTSVPGRPLSSLQQDLRWYLEQFLELPVGGNLDLARRVQDALKQWGQDCFRALFREQAYLWFHEARQEGLENLHLKISSDDPRVLAWPWEALHDPEADAFLAHRCRIERQIGGRLPDPPPLPGNLPQDRVNILLVVARPHGGQDVGFHALSRPLAELARDWQTPVHVDVLRPPTFGQLRRQLRDRPGFYHIVHFDGHGGYGDAEAPASAAVSEGRAQGRLLFEDDGAGPAPVEAEKLGVLLAECRIPIMVLNACQSARIDGQAENAFASVAGALLKAGVRSVVAMGYRLYVGGAQQFVPAFYRRLLETGSPAEAVRAGRQQMLAHDLRPCLLGEHPLQDWLVPVLHQQTKADEAVLPRLAPPDPAARPVFAPDPLPEQARQLGDDGFVGRQQAVQQLERALLRQPQAGLLVHGMAGMGKTTLAKGFLHWLRDTGGLGRQVFWFSFDEVRSAEFVVDQLADAVFGPQARAAELDRKTAELARVFKEQPFLIVWDNFESAAGLAGTAVRPMLSEADRRLLKDLLGQLRGGRTKVLLASRSVEPWLDDGECFRVPLSGLRGEELWQFCNQALLGLGLRVKRDDEDFRALVEELDGHPLALRTVLLQLKEKTPGRLLADLRKALAGLEGDKSGSRLLAALAVLDQDLPEAFGPVLRLVGLHRRFVNQNFLGRMLQAAGQPDAAVQPCLALLQAAGLVHAQGGGVFQMHPALQGHLEQRRPAEESMQRAFADLMGRLAELLAPRELHVQRLPFALHQGSMQHALDLARRLGMDQPLVALLQGLASHALRSRDHAGAAQLLADLAEHGRHSNNPKIEAVACHQLGMVAQARRDFAAAELWYRKSLDISEKLGDEHLAAKTYHNLGAVAQARRDFAAAEEWYQKSLDIEEKLGDQHGKAITWHQLGSVALEQRDFAAAEECQRNSLAFFEKLGDEHGAASTWHQLGSVALEQRDFATAELWFKKSLSIKEKLGDEHGAASTWHQLGIVAEEKRDFAKAEEWHRKSLAVKEKLGDEHGKALTYHQLGMVAQKQRDFAAAEEWYQKSLAVEEKLGDEHGKANSYHQLGIVAQEQGDFATAEKCYGKSLDISEKLGDQHGAALTYHQLGRVAEARRDFAAAEQWHKKSLAIKEKLGDEHGAASTWHQLGIVAQKQGDFAKAEEWYRKSLAIFEKLGDQHLAAFTYAQLGLLAGERGQRLDAGSWLLKAVVFFAASNDRHRMNQAMADYARNLLAASPEAQALLRQQWQQAGLDQIQLEQQLNERN